MELQKKIDEIKQEQLALSKQKKELQKKSELVFDEFCQFIWNKYPNLESFGWNQYTPYFNDGDTCVFHANTDYLKINGETAEDAEWYSEINIIKYGTWNREKREYVNRVTESNQKFDSIMKEACDYISDFLSLFDNEFYQSKFGDHCSITISKTGIEVEDYDHD